MLLCSSSGLRCHGFPPQLLAPCGCTCRFTIRHLSQVFQGLLLSTPERYNSGEDRLTMLTATSSMQRPPCPGCPIAPAIECLPLAVWQAD